MGGATSTALILVPAKSAADLATLAFLQYVGDISPRTSTNITTVANPSPNTGRVHLHRRTGRSARTGDKIRDGRNVAGVTVHSDSLRDTVRKSATSLWHSSQLSTCSPTPASSPSRYAITSSGPSGCAALITFRLLRRRL